MNISEKMQEVFSKQIVAELYSSNLYLQMAFWFRKEGWKGFANYMHKQSDEERAHALDMAQFVFDRGGEVKLSEIKSVKTDWKDAKEIFENVLAHEQQVTEMINKLADTADEEHDRASQNFADKYIDEQVEEEKNARDMLDDFVHQSNHENHALTHIDKKYLQA